MRAVRRMSLLWRDERGEADTVDWILVQIPLLFVVFLVFVVAIVGIKQSGTAAQAHAAARLAGTATLAAGQSAAHTHAPTWSIPAEAAILTPDGARRAITVRWAYAWESGADLITRVLGAFQIDTQGLHRREAFYAGPPGAWE